jgi:hypothetical protein
MIVNNKLIKKVNSLVVYMGIIHCDKTYKQQGQNEYNKNKRERHSSG